ncbi:hypothetical protein C367_06839 [Cryptococcus neoformans Ze90-1]|nr:hypothetical protein C367_06839 [Cryptococcus neoformans var. grubii Ze90-1]
MVRCLEGVEEVDIERLEPAAHLCSKKDHDNVPSPTCFMEIHFGVNIMSTGVKGVFKPFQHHIAVDPT